MNSKNFIFVLIFFGYFLTSYGQEKHPDCVSAKKFTLPLRDSVLDSDEIYYQPQDKYTYWYKVTVTSDCNFAYNLTSITKEDGYEMLLYKYKGNDFCNDRIIKKIKPFSVSAAGNLAVKKGDQYYLGVLHLKGDGCGHILSLKENNKSSIISAIQNDCVEDALEIMLEKEPVIDTIKPEVLLKADNKIKGVVINSVTHKNIEANIIMLNVNGKVTQEPVSATVNQGFKLNAFREDTIVLSITKFGYETFLDTIVVESDSLHLSLNPIKVGEKLVMYDIYFHPNTYALKDESKGELVKLTAFMLENDKYTFEIQGHTNGNKVVRKNKRYQNMSEEWNFKGSSKKLSKLRAEKIKSYLIKKGVSATQLQTVGYGGDQMVVAKPKNMKQAMKNIRVEVIVVQ